MMRNCLNLVATLIASLAIYGGVFIFVADKPLTIGFIRDAFDIKHAYATQAKGPKLVVAAGSGALFGIRCASLEKLIGRPCVNGAITGELGLRYSFDLAKRLVKRGDVVIMPLEFGFYNHSRAQIGRQSTHPYRVRHDLASLWQLTAGEIMQGIFQFDLRYLISAMVETGLGKMGISRRFSRDTLTPNGDMRFHTAENGAMFRRFVDAQRLDTPRSEAFRIGDGTRQAITDFARWAKTRGVRILGTLPTSFDDRPIDKGVVTQIKQLFRDVGHDFFVVENLSQYPRRCFYDSPYHLNEACQQQHTRKLAKALKPLTEGQ